MANATPQQAKPEPLDVTACTFANVRKASRALSQVYDAALQPAKLRATQFTVLATLSKQGPLPLSQLADVMGAQQFFVHRRENKFEHPAHGTDDLPTRTLIVVRAPHEVGDVFLLAGCPPTVPP